MANKVSKYLGEVNSELKKATWPWDPSEKGIKKYKQLIDSTIVVIIAMLILGAFVAAVDFCLRALMKFLTVDMFNLFS